MSCGKPHAHDCTEVLRRVYTFIDGEATSADCVWIQEHLDECGPCLQEYGIDKKVKELVSRACGCDPVPQDVRDRMLGRITTMRTTTVIQGDAGYSASSVEVTRVQFDQE